MLLIIDFACQSHACIDINECLETNGHCSHTCYNTDGSYYCTCNDGFFLLEDKAGCTGVHCNCMPCI